jgi:hypothetical protein
MPAFLYQNFCPSRMYANPSFRFIFLGPIRFADSFACPSPENARAVGDFRAFGKSGKSRNARAKRIARASPAARASPTARAEGEEGDARAAVMPGQCESHVHREHHSPEILTKILFDSHVILIVGD